MWKNYAADYLRNNRPGSSSIIAASFIAALFLSLLCSLFYNFWLDSIEGTRQEEGGWHGRITADLSDADLEKIYAFDNVEKVVINPYERVPGGDVREDGTEGRSGAVEIYFYNRRTVYEDMQKIVNSLGLPADAADYNYQLLSLYFIRIPGDEMPRLLMPAYLAIITLVCISLILVIHNSFAVSMNNRVRQFGIFSSIGATPKQIRICLLQEAFALSALPVLTGTLLGTVFSFGIVSAMGSFAAGLAGGRRTGFAWHPVVLALILLLSFFTVYLSARIPAGRLSRLTPLEAIRGTEELQLRKKKHTPVLSGLFGIEGELAGAALRAQRKALRTTAVSLTFAFLGFMLMQCFFTLSGISTRHTYFEAYQDVWDVYVTVRDAKIEEFEPACPAGELKGAESCVIYQKGKAVSMIRTEDISPELSAAGGLEKLAGISKSEEENAWLVETPLVILDDKSFEEYCGQIGVETRNAENGIIVLNRIWDSSESNFRYPEYIPYIREETERIALQSIAAAEGSAERGSEVSVEMPLSGEKTASVPVEVPVLACTQYPPVLREEYGKSDYPLVQFASLSYWEKALAQTDGVVRDRDIYIRALAKDRESPEALEALEDSVRRMAGGNYEVESENRIQEKKDNDTMIWGYKLILGGLCSLLAVIGIAHVFSCTAGFLRQRKREFARYMSVGLTPEGARKIFCIEAAVIVGRPLLITLFLTAVLTSGMIRASYLDPMEFIEEAPVLPILAFVLAVSGSVALAYLLGGRKILQIDPADALRDDMML